MFMIFLKKLQLLWNLLSHKEAPWSVKTILVLGFFYIIFPADILPDTILLAGWLDDLLLAIVTFILAMKLTPEELLRKLWTKINSTKKL